MYAQNMIDTGHIYDIINDILEVLHIEKER
jgi:transposase